MNIYKEPFYYEIAFSFVNPKKQVDLFEKFIERFSKIKVKRVLDIGCGPALQLREMAKRGYEAVGLDLSPQMLDYLKQKAKEERINIETIKSNMTHFKLTRKADFAFIMMGTIGYIKSNEEFLSHLSCVANSLKRGGLYLIENFIIDWRDKTFSKPQNWTMERDKVKIRTEYKLELKDVLNQIITETIKFKINNKGKKLIFEEREDRKLIFPQELLTLIKYDKNFEFLGFFERDKLRQLTKANNDNIVLLRRK